MLSWLISNIGHVSFAQLIFRLFAYAILVFAVLPLHEFAHAFAAHLLGDDTAKWNGRLTLNPLKHLDPLGALMLVFVGVGYAKPVPVNPFNFRNRKRDMALTALAGPASNLLMAVVAVALFRVCSLIITDMQVLTYFWLVLIVVIARVNIGLAVFNLLPIPPLDGSRIFGLFLPERWTYTLERYSRQITLVVMVLLLVGVLNTPLGVRCARSAVRLCRPLQRIFITRSRMHGSNFLSAAHL